MHRFASPSENIKGEKIEIRQEQFHHLKNVLRLKPQDEVCVIDEKGFEYFCKVEDILVKMAVLRITKKNKVKNLSKAKLAIACAIPKKSRFDDIIDKLTQLGVDTIIPLVTERTIVKPDKHKQQLRLERWKKIAVAATLQSQRGNIPEISRIKDFQEFLSEAKGFDLKLIPTLTGERKPLKELLLNHKPEGVLIAIGPEGDFTEKEIESAKREGFIPVTLGELVLRVDTAAIAVASFIRLFYENY